MRLTPFHERTAALCRSFAWKEWSGYAAVCTYDRHSEREYFAFRHTCGVIDVTPLYKYDLTGPGAGALLSRVWCRDIAALKPGQVVYSAMADHHGKAMDDGTVACLGKDHFRMSSSEPWLRWLQDHARGLDVRIEDTSAKLAVLALQGPLARDVLRGLVDYDLDKMRFFRVRKAKIAGKPGWVSRTGYTGDLGYELWVSPEDALAVWDALIAAGAPFGLEPCGLDALDVVRIEAGFILKDVDYYSAKSALTEFRKSSPFEIGLGWSVELDRAPFLGQEPLRAEKEKGSEWAMVGLALDWAEIEKLHEEYGLPPSLGPVASRAAVPVLDASGVTQIGQATSRTWSPLLKKPLAIGQVKAAHGATGTRVRVEYTVEYERRTVGATVVDRPFFDPERKKSVNP